MIYMHVKKIDNVVRIVSFCTHSISTWWDNTTFKMLNKYLFTSKIELCFFTQWYTATTEFLHMVSQHKYVAKIISIVATIYFFRRQSSLARSPLSIPLPLYLPYGQRRPEYFCSFHAYFLSCRLGPSARTGTVCSKPS